MKKILVTGGAGFIGSNFIRYVLNKYKDYKIVNLDKLTYCGNLHNLEDMAENKNYSFVKGDITDRKVVEKLIKGSDVVVNFAAETHVDRSIGDAESFIKTNAVGTNTLLDAARKNDIKKFIQVSCYDAQTRALTPKGFKTYKELKKGDLVFSLNPKTQEIELKPIEKIIIQYYNGKMVYFHNKRVNLLVTPNHKMFILNKNKKKLLVEEAEKASRRSIFYLPEGYWKGKNEEYVEVEGHGSVETKDLMYILGIFIGDGFTSYQEKEAETKSGLSKKEYLKASRDRFGRFKKTKKQGDHKTISRTYRIFFDIPRHDKCRKKVESVLSNLGIEYSCHDGKAGSHIYFNSKPFMEFFNQCSKGAHNKQIPRWALEYSPEYLKYLFEGLMDSDGSRHVIYYTVSKKLVANFCELCVKLNLKPKITNRYTDSTIENRIVRGASSYVFVGNTRKSISRNRISKIDYGGYIWCLKVKDNKNFLVERGGKINFCGNTDEVYGSITKGSFKETDPLRPNSPYSASKASGDLIARSYFVTYNLPIIITRSSNNFGPFQYPEKVIPLFITNLLNNKKIPLYADGMNVRDWLFVKDNCSGIDTVLHKGSPGEIYNIGAGHEITNLELTSMILDLLGKDKSLIKFVKDRPGHDKRYALDISKMKKLGWSPKYDFKSALKLTIEWYKNNRTWWERLVKCRQNIRY